MKTKMFCFFVALFAISFVFSSCEEDVVPIMQTQTETVETKIIETTPGSGGVVFAKEITVEQGQTVWGYSDEVYGSGGKWRDIVLQNKFLQEPGRVYFDKGKNKWIAKIYPGEVVKIDGQAVLPTYIFYDKTTTTTISQPLEDQKDEKDGLAWYWILLIILGAIILGVWVSRFINPNSDRLHYINVRPGQNLDQVTGANIDMARYDRACRATENAANQMLGRQDILEANATTVFSPNGEINFNLRANYKR